MCHSFARPLTTERMSTLLDLRNISTWVRSPSNVCTTLAMPWPTVTSSLRSLFPASSTWHSALLTRSFTQVVSTVSLRTGMVNQLLKPPRCPSFMRTLTMIQLTRFYCLTVKFKHLRPTLWRGSLNCNCLKFCLSQTEFAPCTKDRSRTRVASREFSTQTWATVVFSSPWFPRTQRIPHK